MPISPAKLDRYAIDLFCRMGATADVTLQSLLKEMHALRAALEQTNRVGPRIQIALARMQAQEERVRNATRELQQVRNQIPAVQGQR